MPKSVLFIEYPKCSTCKKAKKWLDEHGVPYTDRHIVKDNPTADELRMWAAASGLPLRRFFNTSGMLYRELNVKAQLDAGMSDDDAFALLASNGMLVKRPLVVITEGGASAGAGAGADAGANAGDSADGSAGAGAGAGDSAGAGAGEITGVLVGFKEAEWEKALA